MKVEMHLDDEAIVVRPACQHFDCGEIIMGLDMSTEAREVRPMVELWEGGPQVSDPGAIPQMEPGHATVTAQPCGHVQDDVSKLTWIVRDTETFDCE